MTASVSSAAIILALLSTVTAAAAAICVHIAARHLPIGEIIFFRGLCALPVLLVFARIDGPLRTTLRVKSLSRHLQRALIGCAGLTCYYLSISLMPLPFAVAVSYLVPTCVALMEASRSNWSSGFSLIAAALVGLVGVYLILGQQVSFERLDGSLSAGLLCGVVGAVLTSAALLRVKALAKSDSPAAIALYFSLACTFFGFLTLWFGWASIDSTIAAALVGCGTLSAISHVTLTMALKRADAAKVAPFDYLILVWTFAYEIVVFSRSLTAADVAGTVGVLAATQIPRMVRFARATLYDHFDR